VIFAGAVLLANAIGGEGGLVAMRRASRDAAAVGACLAVLRTENARLRREADALRHDPAAIEIVARRDLGLIRPGERVVILAR